MLLSGFAAVAARGTAGARAVANGLTVARALSVVPVCLLLGSSETGRQLAFLLFSLAAASDWLDGYVARRYGGASAFGRRLDPIADKVLVCGVLGVLIYDGKLAGIDMYPAVCIIAREIAVSILRETLAAKNVELSVTSSARRKTFLEMVAVAMLLLHAYMGNVVIGRFSVMVLWVAALLAVVSAVDYVALGLIRLGRMAHAFRYRRAE